MLSDKYSFDICSLGNGEPKYALSLILNYENNIIVSKKFIKTVICNKSKSYNDVDNIIKNKIQGPIFDLYKFTRTLTNNFDLVSTKLVEYYMLLYNSLFAEILYKYSNNTILRVHKSIKFNNECKNKIHFYKGSLEDKTFLKWVFLDIKNKKLKVDGVIHFAGLKAVEESILEPILYWQSNIIGTLNLLEIMKKNSCKNLVFSSSAALYESKDNIFLSEKSSIKPINPYANTKLTIETILKDIFNSAAGGLVTPERERSG